MTLILTRNRPIRSEEYRDPPKAPPQKAAKQAAKHNVEVSVKIRSFAEAMFFDVASPFRHGFSAYHFGMIQQTIKTKLANKEENLITDVAAGIYPTLQDWAKFAPEGTWDTADHDRTAMGVKMTPGKFPPIKGVIPLLPLVLISLQRN